MRVLVLTNQFARFGGSEIVALEVAQWFCDSGDVVTLAANHIAPPITSHAERFSITADVESFDLGDFDLVWCQHDLLTLLPLAAFERTARERLPYVVLASLSPYELFEHVDAWLARALTAEVLANSDETAREQVRRAHGGMARSSVKIFHNAAPPAFWREGDARPECGELRKLLIISNHPPEELVEALAMLRHNGVAVKGVGDPYERHLVAPSDISSADAVITIGKSVPYAIACRRPAYMYDRFGGDGWLVRKNAQTSMAHNFSGRPAQRRLSAEAIAREIVDGFAAAQDEVKTLGDAIDLKLLSLDTHLAALRERALRARGEWRAAKLRLYLMDKRFRAHLETLHAKSAIMRRSFILSV